MSNKNKHKNRTLFAVGGSLHEYPGDCIGLNLECSADEWNQAVEDTFHYLVYLKALKDTGIPKLQEQWSRQDETYLRMLGRTVARMRNIDPMLFLRLDEAKLLASYRERIESSVFELTQTIAQVRADIERANTQEVSDL